MRPKQQIRSFKYLQNNDDKTSYHYFSLLLLCKLLQIIQKRNIIRIMQKHVKVIGRDRDRDREVR
jgi:hypothetical protein